MLSSNICVHRQCDRLSVIIKRSPQTLTFFKIYMRTFKPFQYLNVCHLKRKIFKSSVSFKNRSPSCHNSPFCHKNIGKIKIKSYESQSRYLLVYLASILEFLNKIVIRHVHVYISLTGFSIFSK